MAGVKSLAKDTAVYGLSSIVGRFLNWCLVPLYTIRFAAEEYGVVTFVYSVVALALLVLTYGMETGFFRFANHDRYRDPMEVYSTSLLSLAATSSVFIALVMVFLPGISALMQCAGHSDYIAMMAIAVAIDAFTALPFSYLRYRRRAMRFATIKLAGIAINIGLNLYWILLCPWLMDNAPSWALLYTPGYGIGYIFLANLISSALTLLLLAPELAGFRWRFNGRLWREMIAYSWPLLVLGVAGIMNQTIDKVIFPWLVADKAEAMRELGIYGANYKIAIVMVMFIQAFRFAYEPFIFAQNREKTRAGSTKAYSDAMKWFVICSMFIFLGVMFYLHIVRYFISPRYFEGLKIVPVIMLAEFFFGVFFNLSLWYKLTDKTRWGMWFSLFGLAITLALNIVLVPRIGYMGCALSALACYGSMMVASYLVGLRFNPIPYDMKRLGLYFFSALALWGVAEACAVESDWINYIVRAGLLGLYVLLVLRVEHVSFKQLIPRRL